MSQEIIFTFENTDDAVHAATLMKEADPSLRYKQTRAAVFVTWHANIFAAAQAVHESGIQFSLEFWSDIKASAH